MLVACNKPFIQMRPNGSLEHTLIMPSGALLHVTYAYDSSLRKRLKGKGEFE